MTSLTQRLRAQLDAAVNPHVAVTARDLLAVLQQTTHGSEEVTLSVEDLDSLVSQAEALERSGGQQSLRDLMENLDGTDGPVKLRPLIELTSGQIQQLADFCGDEGPTPLEDQTQFSLQQADGHSGLGLYAWLTELPEEGAILLDGIPAHHRTEEDLAA